MDQSHQVRQCICCRRKAYKRELLRIVWQDGKLMLDAQQCFPGRGAYVHRSVECAERAGSGSAWVRALRLPEGVMCPAVLQALAADLRVLTGGAEHPPVRPKRPKVRF